MIMLLTLPYLPQPRRVAALVRVRRSEGCSKGGSVEHPLIERLADWVVEVAHAKVLGGAAPLEPRAAHLREIRRRSGGDQAEIFEPRAAHDVLLHLLEHACRHAFAFAQESEQNVLRAHVSVL